MYKRYNECNTRTSLEDAELGQTNAKTREYRETWDLLIVFKDEPRYRNRKVIINVEDYGLCATNTDIFWFKKEGFTNFMPKDNIVYFGREEDYGKDEAC